MFIFYKMATRKLKMKYMPCIIVLLLSGFRYCKLKGNA